MPSATLPTFSRVEVESHNTESSCFVLFGRNVHDVSDFVNDHPGGAHLILDYAGKDITEILKDQASHTHSDTAYEVLDDSLVGFIDVNDVASGKANVKATGKANGKVNGSANGNANGKASVLDGSANGVNGHKLDTPCVDQNALVKDETGNWVHPRTGMACEDDLNRETNFTDDYRKHKFLDLNRPLLPQVWFGGFTKKFYLEQVHRPRHYKGGKSAPLFGNFLEPLSLTPWWAVPTLWLPPMGWGMYTASKGFENNLTPVLLFASGFFVWSLTEYIIHRFLFHLDYFLPNNRVAITLHFLLHGVHHYLPMDKNRLVMPPALFVVLATPFWKLAHRLFWWDWNIATAAFCGGIFGYICYDLTHYFLHHKNLPFWYKELKKYHLAHHFLDYELGFGVTSKFWDKIFGTELVTVVKAN
ncbi:hypothetical protein MKZ38_002363 [Zalerion maritima]|uniref:Cytochrome b5 heme-binding domain-containing protein n=1 Tax=Zalerion maritima TaxID=339359 RepID=A0AAD5RYQ8_9PEZI|nr:hypothetical protein MKZ38_002363 [Zalerion maritima]